MIHRTGVRATRAMIEEAIRRAKDVRKTPMAKVRGRWLNEEAAEAFGSWLDAQAKSLGLPDPVTVGGEVSHYGMAADGEFTVEVE